MVNGIKVSSHGGSLLDILKKTQVSGQEAGQETLEQSTREMLASAVPPIPLTPFSDSFPAGLSPMMAGNFTKTGSIESHESSTAQAQKRAKRALSVQASRQNAILTAGLAELATAENLAEQITTGKRAKERILREKHQATTEASERNLDEIKDNIKQKARKALAPQNAEARAIDGQGDTNETTTPPSSEPRPQQPNADGGSFSHGTQTADVTHSNISFSGIQTTSVTPATPSLDILV